jgi:hypothetical protein
MRVAMGDLLPTVSMYQFPENSVLAALRAGNLSFQSGLGDVAQPQPNAGTFSDVNCPTSCWFTGGVTGDLLGRQACWPCYNLCPAGTVWDTTALACSATPATTSPTVPVVQQSPGVSAIQAAGQALGSYLPWVVVGLVALVALPMVLRR